MISARMDFTTLKGRLENVNNLVVVLHLGLATLLVIAEVDHAPAMRTMLDVNVTPVQEETMVIQVVNLVIVHLLALATLLVIVKVDHVLAMRIMLGSNVDPVQGDTMIILVVMVTLVSYYQVTLSD